MVRDKPVTRCALEVRERYSVYWLGQGCWFRVASEGTD